MAVRNEVTTVAVDGEPIPGTRVSPGHRVPGVPFVQGWGNTQEQYLVRAREIAALGCVCLTFEPRGVAKDDPRHETVTREENLRDVLAAYDTLAGRAEVDPAAIAMVGSSDGAYLAVILSSLRTVRGLALRVAALYKDEDWDVPKARLHREALAAYRRAPIAAKDNRALGACAAFGGAVLVLQSNCDDTIPPSLIADYRAAFEAAHSLMTCRMIAGADHGLSEERRQQAHTSQLVNWVCEMVLGAREGGATAAVQAHLAPVPRRGPPAQA